MATTPQSGQNVRLDSLKGGAWNDGRFSPKELNFFEGQKSISFDLLKTVQQFVAGYEVEACALSLWEIAILKGYEVFRQVKSNSGGIIVCDRSARAVEYAALA